MSYKPDAAQGGYTSGIFPVTWMGRNKRTFVTFRPAHPSIYLFRAIDASGGQLFEKSWTKTFVEAAARHF
jgi:hypothetical protein